MVTTERCNQDNTSGKKTVKCPGSNFVVGKASMSKNARDLPSKILLNIFHYLDFDTRILCVAKVCKMWREVLFSSRSLWRKIQLGPFEQVDPTRYDLMLGMFKKYSGDTVESISITRREDKEEFDPTFQNFINKQYHPCLEKFSLDSISYSSAQKDENVISLDLFLKSNHSLAHLDIASKGISNNMRQLEYILMSLPSLKTLRLHEQSYNPHPEENDQIIHNDDDGPIYHPIKSLTLTDFQATLINKRIYFANLENLALYDCAVSFFNNYRPGGEFANSKSVDFQSLRNLYAYFYRDLRADLYKDKVDHQIVMHMPALETLLLTHDISWLFFSPRFQLSFPNVTYLELHLCHGLNDTLPMIAELTSNLIEFTLLHSPHVDPSMVLDLIINKWLKLEVFNVYMRDWEISDDFVQQLDYGAPLLRSFDCYKVRSAGSLAHFVRNRQYSSMHSSPSLSSSISSGSDDLQTRAKIDRLRFLCAVEYNMETIDFLKENVADISLPVFLEDIGTKQL